MCLYFSPFCSSPLQIPTEELLLSLFLEERQGAKKTTTRFWWLFPSKRSLLSTSNSVLPSLLHLFNKLPSPSPRPGSSFFFYSILHVAYYYGTMFHPQPFPRQCQCAHFVRMLKVTSWTRTRRILYPVSRSAPSLSLLTNQRLISTMMSSCLYIPHPQDPIWKGHRSSALE